MKMKKTDAEPGVARGSRPRFAFRTIVATVLLGVVFLVIRWTTFAAPFERDEGEYAYSAWLMGQGKLPYQNAFLQKPPMIVYTYLAGQVAGGHSVVVPRVLAALFLAGMLVCLAFVARCELGPGAGLTAMWLAMPMFQIPKLAPFAANTEVFMLFPLLGALAFYATAKGAAGDRSWFGAGLCAAVALLYKPICLPVLVFLAATWLFETWQATRSRRLLIRRAACGLAGGTLASLMALGWFLATDGGRSLWECAVAFNAHYAPVSSGGLDAVRAQIGTLFSHCAIVFLLLAGFLFKRPPRLWFYGGLILAAELGLYGSWSVHYTLMLVPFLALLATAAVRAVDDRFHLGAGRAALTAIVAVVLLLPARELVGMPPDTVVRRVYPSEPFVESALVARRVAALTQPNDRVFVAGSEPQILYHAQRRSPTRFVTVYPLMFDTPRVHEYHEECVRDLEREPPEVIVFSRAPMSWLQQPGSPTQLIDHLGRMLRTDYRMIGGFVPDATGGQWEEPITAARQAGASLLVFQRVRR
jgi:hypothetical protein